MLTSTDRPFKVAIIQHPPVFLNLEQSLLKARELVEEAANQGAKIIVFPETWLPGYPVWLDYAPNATLWDYPPAKALYRLLVENSLSIGDKHFKTLLDIAKKNDVYLVIGAHERESGTLYNSIIYIDRAGENFRLHRKLIPTYTERLVWGRGDGSTLNVLETDYGILGGLVCWEQWMPLARAAMHAKNEVIHVAQWPFVRDLHQIACRNYAFEGQCFVLAAGCVLSREQVIAGVRSLDNPPNEAIELLQSMPGDDNQLLLRGGSAIIKPNSDYLVEPVLDQTCIIYGDINANLITEGHLELDTSGHYSRPDVFRLEVNDLPQVNVDFKSQEK